MTLELWLLIATGLVCLPFLAGMVVMYFDSTAPGARDGWGNRWR